MPHIIRLGDATSHGGKVTSVSATHFKVGGLPVARVGDVCSCPQKGHDNCTIVEGHPHHRIGGIAVAYEGHKTSCGATLVASTSHFSAS
ncbi:PAAR domain-containing protein [Herbaspirillum rubrisubalbicans]|uniref:PAAR domain-containing protein n=1 Tax=Herbaspirillum rubrisubalbicans TaxID=80842 RepID=UPI001558A008|nr:PAAR domain-containing protein [Herbaspirillum rubrisubalbicans]NQE50820.1 PAAR motif family protein [Herbaspirillum rubrisubalbicans]